jgi:hypothetical protein
MGQSTTRETILTWLTRGQERGATHMIVVCDTFDWSDYPVYVHPGSDPRDLAGQYNGDTMQKVMEVYALHMDLEAQLAEGRAFHFECPPAR